MRSLIAGYKDTSGREVLLRYLRRETDAASLRSVLTRLHIKEEMLFCAFLIRVPAGIGEIGREVLKSLLHGMERDFILLLDERNVLVIRQCQKQQKEGDNEALARTIFDVLSSEAMLALSVCYSRQRGDIFSMAAVYKDLERALAISLLFYGDCRIISADHPVAAELFYGADPVLCRNFLRRVMGEPGGETMDEEIRMTARTFFANNLSIAETARKLHMHRNTLVYRLEQIQKQFGMDIRTFEGAMLFQLALLSMQYLQYREENRNE